MTLVYCIIGKSFSSARSQILFTNRLDRRDKAIISAFGKNYPMSVPERLGVVGVPGLRVLQSESAGPAREPSGTPTLKVGGDVLRRR